MSGCGDTSALDELLAGMMRLGDTNDVGSDCWSASEPDEWLDGGRFSGSDCCDTSGLDKLLDGERLGDTNDIGKIKPLPGRMTGVSVKLMLTSERLVRWVSRSPRHGRLFTVDSTLATEWRKNIWMI